VFKFGEQFRHFLAIGGVVQFRKFSEQLARVIGKSDKYRMVEIHGLCCHV